MKSFFLNDEPAAPVELDTYESAVSLNAMRLLLLVVTLIVVFGLTMLYSASYNTDGLKYFRNQIIWAAMGFAGGTAAFLIGYRKLASWSGVLMGLSFVLLLVAAFCFPAINGANRWIKFRLPGLEMTLQPSEFAKIAVALFVAKYCSENIRTFNQLRGWRGILPLIGISGAVICGILIGRDFGTTALVMTMAVAIAVMAGAALVLSGGSGGFCRACGALRGVVRSEPARTGYDLSAAGGDPVGGGLPALELSARVRVGRLDWGRIHGEQVEAEISAGTAYGFHFVDRRGGARAARNAFRARLYVCFTWFGLRISMNSRSRLGMLLGCGLTLGITLQAAINIAVVTGAAPTKGMPAAFISYGGSNIMASLIAVGILVSIASTHLPELQCAIYERDPLEALVSAVESPVPEK